jgi:hypothetical protein
VPHQQIKRVACGLQATVWSSLIYLYFTNIDRLYKGSHNCSPENFLRDFSASAKVSREDIFKETAGSESLHEISNDNGIRVVNFATSKYLSEVQCSHLVTFINWLQHLQMERHNQIGHILIDRRWHSNVLDVRSFRAEDCDTDQCLVMAKVISYDLYFPNIYTGKKPRVCK